MAISKIKVGDTEHELQTTISNVSGLQDTLNGKVNTSLTINGKTLSSNISLNASDVSAAPAYIYGTDSYTHGVSSLPTGTLYIQYE